MTIMDEAGPVDTQTNINIMQRQLHTRHCFYARFVKTQMPIGINRATKQPIAARELSEVVMWEQHRLGEALKYQGWANKFINQIEVVKGTLTLTPGEVVKEPDLIKVKLKPEPGVD